MSKRLWAVALAGTMLIVLMTSMVIVFAQASAPPTLISIEGGRITHSGALAVNVVGDQFPNGLTGYQLSITTADPSIAVPAMYHSPDFGLTYLDATSTPGTLRFAMTDINSLVGVGAVDALLGTVTFLGKREGITPIHLSIDRMDDEDGSPILTSVAAGLLTVLNSRDLDGDGITEDINGNGFFDFADVVMLFHMLLALALPLP